VGKIQRFKTDAGVIVKTRPEVAAAAGFKPVTAAKPKSSK